MKAVDLDRLEGLLSAATPGPIPDGVQWRIEEYDGSEHIAEDHRTWN